MRKAFHSFHVREIQQSDQDFLFDMLYQAIYVPPGSPYPDRSVLEEPEIRRYAEKWGMEGDFGYIAVDSGSERPIGALWLRYFDSANRGYGYIGDDIPEMSIAVVPEKRGMGVGTALIDALLQYAAGRIKAISLSVDPGNPAIRLYKRFGFKECGTSGHSIIMRRDI